MSILAKKKEDDSDLYIYYNLEKTSDEIDVDMLEGVAIL